MKDSSLVYLAAWILVNPRYRQFWQPWIATTESKHHLTACDGILHGQPSDPLHKESFWLLQVFRGREEVPCDIACVAPDMEEGSRQENKWKALSGWVIMGERGPGSYKQEGRNWKATVQEASLSNVQELKGL